MVDSDGRLIAITVSKIASFNADNMGFGIPVTHLKENIEILLNKKSDDFCIKCSACHNLVYEKSSFCKNCGSPIEKELFDQRNITKLSEKIEEIIQKN
jgi:rRNA maturation endonuclease Nob1